MQIGEYIAAVGRRWLWVAAAAAVCSGVAITLSQVAPDTWQSTTALYIGAIRADDADGVAFAARVEGDVLPSLVAIARSPAVLDPVIADLGLTVPAARLAERLEVGRYEDTSVVWITASASSPGEAARVADRVADEVRAQTGALFRRDQETLLTVRTVRPAEEPRWSSGMGARRAGILGLLGGAALAALGCGLSELRRPRVRTSSDVARLTGAPVLASLSEPVNGPSATIRSAAVVRLRAELDRHAAEAVGRIVVTGPPAMAGRLATELSACAPSGRTVVAVPDDAGAAGYAAESDDRVIVVIDSRRAGTRELGHTLTRLEHLPAGRVGVVIDGRPARHAGLLPLLRATVQGDAPWPELRSPGPLGHVPATARLATSNGLVAAVALVLTGLHLPLPLVASSGLVAVIALLPLWLPAVRWSGALRGLAVLAGAGVVSGALIARSASVDHGFDAHEAFGTALTVLTALGTIGLLFWARTVLPMPLVALFFGLGQLCHGLLHSTGSPNAFKFELTLPLTVIVLGLLAARRGLAVVVLSVLAALDVAHDARSTAGFCVLALVLVLWQARPPSVRRRIVWSRTLLALGVGGMGAYWALSELLLSGVAGAEVQARTAAQINQSGSLLLGGRPEWTATWTLMRAHPLGFGLGTIPSPADVQLAKQGMAVARIPTAEGYIEHYMLARRFELHSVIADLWSNFGPVGVLLGLGMVALLLTRLVVLFHRRQATALLCFLALTGTWFLSFGPLPSDLPYVALALGLLLPGREPAASASTADDAIPGRCDAPALAAAS